MESKSFAASKDSLAEPPRPALARRWLKLGVAGTAGVMTLALCEVVVRVVSPQPPSWLDVYRPHPALPLYTLQAQAHRLVDSGECRWTVRTDAQGFRISSGDPAEAFDMVWLGDSFTFGHGVDHEQCFVGLLQAKAGPSPVMANAAVPGYGPVQYVQTLEYLLSGTRRPRYVVVGSFVGNDFQDCIWNKDVRVREGVVGHRGDLRSFAKLHSHLYRLGSKLYHSMAQDPEDTRGFQDSMGTAGQWESEPLIKAAAVYREKLSELAALCRRHSIGLLVVLIPPRGAVEAAARVDSGPTDLRLPVQRAAAILGELDIPTLDLLPTLAAHPVESLYFTHDGHFTPKGHRIAADAIEQKFRELGWLRP